MQVTVNIPDELAAEIESRGFAVETYFRELVQASVPRRQSADERRRAVDAMQQFAATHGITTGGQSLESMIHEGHKY